MNRILVVIAALVVLVPGVAFADTGDAPLDSVFYEIWRGAILCNPNPKFPAQVSVGDSLLFKAFIVGGAGVIDYYWDFGDDSTIHNGPQVTHIYSHVRICTASVYVTDTLDEVVVGTAYMERIVEVGGSVPNALTTWGRVKKLFE